MARPRTLHLDKRADRIRRDLDGLAGNVLLNVAETASVLGVSEKWLEKARSEGFGPPFLKLSRRCVRYRVDALRRWLRWRPNRPNGRVRLRLQPQETRHEHANQL